MESIFRARVGRPRKNASARKAAYVYICCNATGQIVRYAQHSLDDGWYWVSDIAKARRFTNTGTAAADACHRTFRNLSVQFVRGFVWTGDTPPGART